MEDDLEDKVLYQTYLTHIKLISKIIVDISFNMSTFNYIWKLFRMYLLKPEVLIISLLSIILVTYFQSQNNWSNNFLGSLRQSLKFSRRMQVPKYKLFNTAEVEKHSWEMKQGPIAVYAVKGRRANMEDRFSMNTNINNTGISLVAVFDGHGGEFAANYAKDKLIDSLHKKIIEIKDTISGKVVKCETKPELDEKDGNKENEKPNSAVVKRKSFSKTMNSLLSEDCIKKAGEITDKELLSKLESLPKPITREVSKLSSTPSFKRERPAKNYYNEHGKINYEKLLTDEVLAVDELILEAAKKKLDVAGTTALIAIMEGGKLTVANVGDSRGVMCDNKGNAIPLSFDHKPQQMRERKRIKEAGGFVTFNGVWRVAGILATSRALGDYPLKDKKLVIADPDILTFDLKDHKPSFVILASDGLWDTFSNEEAVAYIKERLDESDYGAKSITLQSYQRGSLDNITVMVINFQNYTTSD